LARTGVGNGPLEVERAVTKRGSAAKRFGEDKLLVETRKDELQKRAAQRVGRCVWVGLSVAAMNPTCALF